MLNRLKCWIRGHITFIKTIQFWGTGVPIQEYCGRCGVILKDFDQNVMNYFNQFYKELEMKTTEISNTLTGIGGSLSTISTNMESVRSFLSGNQYNIESWLGYLISNRPPTGSTPDNGPSEGKVAELEMRMNSQERHIETLEGKIRAYREQLDHIQDSPP